ncbi:DoxX family protein [Saccharopolyspora shandongensis]|uniref:DoxX family protein n=1 Tax=Saccharopolyspora shandongensis TaxID=418495 RepID=UPI0033D1B6EB
MFIAHAVVSVLLAAALVFSAALDFVRYEKVLRNMASTGVPESWLTMLGVIKVVGAVGLLVGIDVPPIGIAAAVGVLLFFVCAVIAHLRVRDHAIGLASGFGLLAVAALGLGLAA